MPRDDRDRFWDLLCAFSNAVYALFVAGFVLLTLTFFTLVNYERVPPAGRIIALVNLVLVSGILVSSGYVLYRCGK